MNIGSIVQKVAIGVPPCHPVLPSCCVVMVRRQNAKESSRNGDIFRIRSGQSRFFFIITSYARYSGGRKTATGLVNSASTRVTSEGMNRRYPDRHESAAR